MRGWIDAGDYEQYIFPLLFFKRLCGVYDEELASALAESGGDEAFAHFARLPDHTLKELIEHFSSLTLSVANCLEDELGVGCEYLIKKFADDSGHTAAEFYTNRTVVHLIMNCLLHDVEDFQVIRGDTLLARSKDCGDRVFRAVAGNCWMRQVRYHGRGTSFFQSGATFRIGRYPSFE